MSASVMLFSFTPSIIIMYVFHICIYIQYAVERKGTLAGPIIVLSSAYDRLEPKRVTVDGAYVHATKDLEVNVAYIKDQEGKNVVEQIELLHLATAVDQETEDQLQVGAARDAQELFSLPRPTMEAQCTSATSTDKKV